jgi:hypothetical protein
LQHEAPALSVLSAEKVRRLSLGVSVLDDVFPGFEAGDFIVLHGDNVRSLAFALCVHCELAPEKGGLGSSVVFVDGGNSFSPYMVAETARSYGLDSKAVLERIHVSRAFTAYQFSSLVLEGLESFLNSKKSKLLVVSDITSLFFDRDIPKTEAKGLFMKVCSRLSKIAARKRAIVLATYVSGGRSRQGLFFEAVLFGKSNVLVKLKKHGEVLSFVLEDHPRVKQFNIDFPTDYALLTAFMEV